MIEFNLINLIGVSYLGIMIAYDFTPLQPAKQKFIQLYPNIISSQLDILLNCPKCVSFWLGLALYTDLIHAAVAGLTGHLLSHLLDRIKVWYE